MAQSPESLIKNFGIGITGNIACGKSAVVEFIREHGYFTVDADQLSRQVLEKGQTGYKNVTKEFGSEILHTDGSIDRKKLGEVIFSSPLKRKKLESLTHPAIAEALKANIATYFSKNEPHFWFYEAALLFEADRQNDFCEVWVVSCDPEIQIQRLMSRSGIDRKKAEERVASQMPAKKKEALADVVIYNNGTLDELKASVMQHLKNLEIRHA